MNVYEARTMVENKKQQLIKIRNCDWRMALTPKTAQGCFRRMDNAKKFLEELKEVDEILYLDDVFAIVSLKQFNACIRGADVVNDLFDGQFCKVAKVHKFQKGAFWIIYLASDRAL